MATFSGNFIPKSQEIPIVGLSASWTGQHPLPAAVYVGSKGEPMLAGTFDNNQPIDIRSINFAGDYLKVFFDDYYNRIYVIPDHIDFGAIIGQATQSFTIWNAYLSTRTLVGITGYDDEDVRIDIDTFPQTFLPLQSRSFVVEADAFGAPQVNASFDLEFDIVTRELTVVGQRGKTWAFAPNWSASVSVQRDYKTDVMTSYNGKEQRRAIRQQPRTIMEFTSLLSFDETRQLRGDLASWQDKPWAITDFSRHTYFSTMVPPASMSADLARVPTWMLPNTSVVLRYEDRFETRTVQSIAGNTVTFTTSLGSGWPAGTKIFPLLTAYLDVAINTTMHTNAAMTVPTRFNIIPGSEVKPQPASAARMFDGREMFLFKPNWAGEVQVNFEHPTESIDYERGRTAIFSPLPFTTTVRQATFLDRDQTESDETSDFFDRMKGRRGEFFAPSWTSDMDARQDANAGTFLLRVQGQDVFNFYSADMVHRTFCIVLLDGTIIPNKIDTLYTVSDITGDDTIIECTIAWPVTVALENILMISWMPLSRLASDSLTVEWVTDTVAQYQISFNTLEYGASEAL